jgi:hypothetical protein
MEIIKTSVDINCKIIFILHNNIKFCRTIWFCNNKIKWFNVENNKQKGIILDPSDLEQTFQKLIRKEKLNRILND